MLRLLSMPCNPHAPTAPCVRALARVKSPQLIKQTHVLHRAGFPLFTGESSLHICAVNQREALLCTLIELAVKHLSRDEVRILMDLGLITSSTSRQAPHVIPHAHSSRVFLTRIPHAHS